MRLSVSGSGPLVIKVAGIAGGVELYREEMDAAIAAGYRVAALDTSGDRRDDPAPGPITWDLLAGEVASAIERLGTRRAIVWGTSFGCLVGLAAAARHPGRVEGLLLCHPPEPLWAPGVYSRALQWIERRDDPEPATLRLFRLGFGGLAGWEFAAPPALARLPALYRESRCAATPAVTIRQKLRLLWEEDPGLARVEGSVPVRVVAGGMDLVTPAWTTRRLARRIPQAQVRWIRLGGHVSAYSRPRTYHRAAVEALRALTEADMG